MTVPASGWTAALASHYDIAAKIGEGATAEVWAAVRIADGRRVAIKVLRREVALEIGTQRFLREIAVAGTLSHPAIVPILESGEADGVPYQVMPLIPGETLRARLARERQLPLDTAIAITIQVADALDAAHAAGVVHRDVKPENILLDGERAFVLDFGIAYAIDAAVGDRITASGLTVGTPQYMSPEQAAAERRLDGRSDVYSLACVVFEMLAGQPPFTGATTQAIRARHVSESPPSIRVVRPSLPAAVDAGLASGLAKSPADRPASASELVARMRAPSSAPTRPSRWRSGVLIALTAGVMAVIFVTVANRLPVARRWVLVADFTAPEGERQLASAVRDLVMASLAQSPVVSLVPNEQVALARRRAQMPDSASLDLTRAREIGYRTTVRAVVAGSIARLGDHAYSVTVHALDVDDGSTLVSEALAAPDTGTALLRAVEQLVSRLRRKLGEKASELAARRPLEQATTPDFEAFRIYHAALARTRVGDYEGSLALLRGALQRDTAFATAWWLSATNHINSLRPDSAEAMYARAMRFSERFEPAERERLKADIALNVDHDPASALRAYELYVLMRPNSVGGHNNRGAMLSALGRHEEALRAVERAMSIDPMYVGPRQIELMNQALELAVLGKMDSARGPARRLTGPQAEFVNLLLLCMEGRWDSVSVISDGILGNPSAPRLTRFPSITAQAAALAARGDSLGATRALEKALAAGRGADLRWFLNARLLFDFARGAPVRWALPAAFAADSSLAASFIRGVHSVGRGDPASAERTAERIRRLPARRRAEVGLAAEVIDALVASRKGEPAEASRAAAALADSARFGEHQPFTQDRAHSYWLRLAASESFRASGDGARADEFAGLLVRGTALPAVHLPLRGFVARYVAGGAGAKAP